MTFPEFPIHGTPVQPPAVRAPVSPPPAIAGSHREPALWTMLSQAERAFFDVPSLVGALSYGPTGATTSATPVVGQQLDIRA